MVDAVAGRRYRILGTIGKGGFGTVYKAALLGEGDFTKVVALKVLNPEAALVDEVAQRLRDEARILALVHHRAIVQVDGLVRFDNQWTIVMEYLEGVDLRDLTRDEPVPLGPALEIVDEIASALHQAWVQTSPEGEALQMLHRDIKPSNVVITAAGEVKVLDFGTARANFAAREAKTQSMAFGTLDYMSPERLEFEDVPAGDCYALGCVLFELLTGEQVGRTSPDPVKHAVVFDSAKETLARHEVREDVRELVLECLAFDPSERPSAAEIARRCRQLRTQGQEQWLVDWAQVAVPPRIASRGKPKKDGMTGVILVESSGTRIRPAGEDPGTVWVRHEGVSSEEEPTSGPVSAGAPAAAAAPPASPSAPPASPSAPPVSPAASPPSAPISEPVPRRSSSLAPLLAVGAVVGVLSLVGVGAIGLALTGGLGGDDEASEPVPVEEVVVDEAPDEPEAAEAAEAPEEEPPEEAAPKPAPVAPAPAPRPRPRPRPAPKAATATVKVAGDAEKVVLVGTSGDRYPAGKIPAGSYTIEATFANRGAVQAGEVELAPGQSRTLTCRGMFGRCDVSP